MFSHKELVLLNIIQIKIQDNILKAALIFLYAFTTKIITILLVHVLKTDHVSILLIKKEN